MCHVPKYKLHYFDARGRGEAIRFIFITSGIPFQDIRVKNEEWPALKGKTIFRGLPYLEVDGDVFGQSAAIGRFLARKYNLAGRTDIEQYQVDAIVDYQKDIKEGFDKFWYEPNPTQKVKMTDEYMNKTLLDHLDVLESHLKTKGDGKYFVKSGPTFADFHVAVFFFTVLQHFPNALAKHDLIKKHCERVHNLPRIREWVAKRPQSDM